jgi:Na+/melibiose symporter-like transporter
MKNKWFLFHIVVTYLGAIAFIGYTVYMVYHGMSIMEDDRYLQAWLVFFVYAGIVVLVYEDRPVNGERKQIGHEREPWG